MATPVKFSDDACADENVLTCPRCGGGYLHHRRIKVYGRAVDDPITHLTEMTGQSLSMDLVPSDATDNPSDRRSGFAILFECETCPAMTELTFAQHKGWTLVDWRNEKPDFEVD